MTIRFDVSATAEARCLPRLLDHFAQRGLIPSVVTTNHVGPLLEIMIEHPTINLADARLICERLRRTVSVTSAVLHQGRAR